MKSEIISMKQRQIINYKRIQFENERMNNSIFNFIESNREITITWECHHGSTDKEVNDV